MILDKILDHKRREVKEKKNARYLADLKAKIREAPSTLSFYQALSGESSRLPCPACGFLVFDKPSGSYDFCSICGWEDDDVQLRLPAMQGGANKQSLYEYQLAWLDKIPLSVQEKDGYRRDASWRPLRAEECVQKDVPRTGLQYFEAAGEKSPYYWQPGAPYRPTVLEKTIVPQLIAEVKKASPSRGVLCENFDPLEIARTYHEHGATALSVLTDREFFQGSLDHLRSIREKVPLPALNKEFMVDELQFYEARAHLADAVLLIVAALDRVQLVDFYHLARQEFGLDVLLEAHHERELDLVLERLPEARIIGINNRDLTTFVTTLDVTLRLAKRVPEDKVIVSESGIFTRDDVKRVAEAGVRAILVGESLMTAKDIGAKIKELLGREEA